MKLTKADNSFSRNDASIESFQWGILSFRQTDRGIRINGAKNLNERARFENLYFYNDEKFLIAESTNNRDANKIYIFNKNGDVAANYVEISEVVEDDGHQYIVVYKNRNYHNMLCHEMYLIDTDDMRTTNNKNGIPNAHGIQCELCELRQGLMVIKNAHGKYIFTATHKYPRFFDNRVFISYEHLGGYKYLVNKGLDNEMEIDFSARMNRCVRESKLKLLIVFSANPRIDIYKYRNTIASRIDFRPFNLINNDEVLAVQEGTDDCYRLRYTGNVTMPIVQSYRLDTPLPYIVDDGRRHKLFSISDTDNKEVSALISEMLNLEIPTNPETHKDVEIRPYVPDICSRENLIRVFGNNLDLLSQGWYSTDAGKVYLNACENLPEKSIVYEEEISNLNTTNYNTVIEVRHIDCLEMAKELIAETNHSGNVAVLNMANARDPELRVSYGAKEQEAYLMRCSDYYNSLSKLKDVYPISGEYSGIYTPGVTVFRNPDYSMADEPWKVNVIAVAGLPRPVSEKEQDLLAYLLRFQSKVRTILRIAMANGQTNLVLGAIGCGGLHNIPKSIAMIFHYVLAEPEFKHAFEKIVFAMLPIDGPDEIFDAFCEEFKSDIHSADDINQCLKKEIKLKRRPFTNNLNNILGRLSTDNIKALSKAIDNEMLDKDYAEKVLKFNFPEVLLCFAEWVYRNPDVTSYNLNYLIPYEDEDAQDELTEIIWTFLYEIDDTSNELYETGGWSWIQVYDYLVDECDELLIAIGYFYAVQQLRNETDPNE